VFHARETLFLGRGDDLAVANERRRAVVIEGRDAQDVHHRAIYQIRLRALVTSR
jgi:hypothetical protein